MALNELSLIHLYDLQIHYSLSSGNICYLGFDVIITLYPEPLISRYLTFELKHLPISRAKKTFNNCSKA